MMRVIFPPVSLVRGLTAALWAGSAALSLGQATGFFVIPAQRADNGTRFSYWDKWALPPNPTSANTYHIPHYPNVLGLGDEDGNPSNYNTNVNVQQVKTPTAFLAGQGSIYSYMAATGFEINYTHTGTDPVAGVILQLNYSGNPPLGSSVKLRYTPAGSSTPVLLSPQFRALDDPGTGGFLERIIRGYEWNVTGLGVTDYQLLFECEFPHMAFFEAQLDTSTGANFQQALGWLLSTRAYPSLRFATAGFVDRDLPSTAEYRFFTAGSEVPLSTSPTSGFAAVGWVKPDGTLVDSPDPFTVEFDSTNPVDLTAGAIFSPITWSAFRTYYFWHDDGVINTTDDDYTNDAISAPGADPDKDGLTNYAEYAFGGDPYTFDPQVMNPVPSLVAAGGVNYPAITYRRRAGDGDVRYLVEQSTDLTAWSSGTEANPVTEETPGPLSIDGTRLVTARSLTPAGGTPVFLRVRALPVTP